MEELQEVQAHQAPWILSIESSEDRTRVRTRPHGCTGCGRTIRWARATCWDCHREVARRVT